MAETFKNTIYSMVVDYDMESDVCEAVYDKTDKFCEELLGMVDEKKRERADRLIDEIAFQNKVVFYQAGFRKAMNIMLDTLYGKSTDSLERIYDI